MGIFSFGQKKKSLEELEEEDERAEVELSLEKKRALIRELRARGQDPNHFKDGKGGFNFTGIINWLKTH